MAALLNRRLLIISWAMPPLLLPRAIQVPRTLKALSALGWSSTVFSGNFTRPWRGLRYDTSMVSWCDTSSYTIVPVASPERWSALRLLWRILPFTRPLPDEHRLWAGNVARAACRRLTDEPFGAMISFAQPWSSHWAALHIHRRTGTPWIAHFSDPWVDSPYIHNTARQREIWCRQEEAVIREADAVVFVTPQTVDLVMRKYPAAWRNKAYAIPHGYDPNLLKHLTFPAGPQPRLRLVYTGNFYGNRTPLPLFHALAVLHQAGPLRDRLEVSLVGASDRDYRPAAAEMGLGDIVTFQPPAPFLESLQIAAQADVLLVLDAPSDTDSVFLPSKLVDYLMLQKPILGITPPVGASADLLRSVECPIVAPDDVPGIAAAIAGLLAQWRQGTLTITPTYTRVARTYDIYRITRALDDILRSLAPG